MLNILCMIVAAGLTTAAAAGSLSGKEVDAVLSKYRQAEAFKANVKKTVAQEVLSTENFANGKFYFSKGKLRLEMAEPENTTLVYDGKTVWMETRLDAKTVEVTKIKTKILKKKDSLLAALFDRKDLLKTFRLLRSREDKGLKLYTFEPKDKKKTEVLILEIGLNGKELSRIAYKDDRENLVTFDFTDLVREPIPAATFSYKPPKGANVTDL